MVVGGMAWEARLERPDDFVYSVKLTYIYTLPSSSVEEMTESIPTAERARMNLHPMPIYETSTCNQEMLWTK